MAETGGNPPVENISEDVVCTAAPTVADTNAPPEDEPILLDGAPKASEKAQEKGKRARKHPIWDDPALGVERMNAVLIQVCATDPWTLGGRHAAWKKITEEVLKHPSFAGLDIAWKTLNDTVVQWIKNFATGDYKNRFKTGTDDEKYTELEQLLTEVASQKSSADALDAEGKEAVTEEQRKKNADQAAAVSLLDASAAALQTKEAARKKGKREFKKLNDNEVQMEEEEEEQGARRAKGGRVSAGSGLSDSIRLFLEEKKEARLERKAEKEERAKERAERWALEKAEREQRMLLERQREERMLELLQRK
ncbi:hypothetical protein CYMTET_27232 [Cymbomonas tetramitiformis]|uniref:No apical meristem-associated C-terminal domain-containing protein n=1 Tax=Cymbomonas tetramitiformis TaxID=36881 RepID=A0AAE0KX72_9CHLO|nr:hypothetical protein CYMTET_27232 [Cymbomonas tetramitiformis]